MTNGLSVDEARAFPHGEGELAALIRAYDWASTSMGPIELWPQSIRTVVETILMSPVPIVTLWGEDGVMIYNDAYSGFAGGRHPVLLGSKVREGWPEVADFNDNVMKVGLAGGTLSYKDQELTLHRSGRPEQVWMNLDYSPVLGEDGVPVGVISIVVETSKLVVTNRKLSESEGRFHALSDSIDQMIWTTLPDGYHDYYNRRWYEFTGVPDGSTDGDGWNDMFHPDDQDRAWAVWRQCLETGEPYHIEYRLKHHSGSYRWVLGRAQPVRDAAGRIARWYGTCTDIDDLKIAEDAVRATEERYRLALGATNDAIWDWDFASGYVRWNEALENAYGHRLTEVEPTGAWWIEHIHPDDRRRVDESIHAVIDGDGTHWIEEYRFRRADGSHADVVDRGTVVRDERGRAVRMIGAMLDLSERKANEKALASSSERLRLATQAAAIGTWDFDPVSGNLQWDARTKELFGLSPDADADYQLFLSGLHPDDREATDIAVQHALSPNGDGVYDVEYRTVGVQDGVERWVAAKGGGVFENGRAVRFVGTVIDITPAKRAAEELAGSRALLEEERQALEVLNTTAARIAAELDLERLTQIVTDAGVELTGAQFGAFFYNVVNSEGEGYMLYSLSGVDRGEFDAFPMPRNTLIFATTFNGEGPLRSDDIVADPRYGKLGPHFGMPRGHLPVRSYLSVPVTSRSGEVIGGLFFGHDRPGMFSERAERLMIGLAAQAAIGIDNARLFEARQRLNKTLESQVAARTAERDRIWQVSLDLLGVADHRGIWASVNPAWTRVLGWSPDEIVGKTSEWLEHPDDRENTRSEVGRLAAGQQTIAFENRLRTKSGEYRNLLWSAVPMQDQLYCVARDVTEQRQREAELQQTQDRLRQAQKMETVGQLTGGVAHDFNNLLQIVTGNLEILLRSLPDDAARLRRAAENAQRGAQRAATLTQRLLAFSRRQPLAPKKLDANRLVGGMSELLHRTLGETVEIETVLAPRLWQVEADPNQLENALLNLAINGRDAMAAGGKLTIETSNAHLDRAYAEQDAEVAPGQYVAICVSDTGEGIDAETLTRVFEPFFTTKEVGKGTGLGLSMVYGFVKQSGGHVRIYSELGHGTSVRIYLPRLVNEVEDEEEAADQYAPEGSRHETILVLEDDDDVRAYSVEVLRELGYAVVEAHDGPTALRLLEREGRIDLLFSDVVLPGGMTGAQVAAEASRLRPGLRILFTTGYARNAIVHHGRLDAGVELLTKPFTYADLAARVRDLLDKPA